MFQTSPAKKEWDGIFDGQKVLDGIYIYMLTVTDQFGDKHYFNGNVTLMR
jgi:hypothetical protein